jgi:hypothetical protein
MASADLLARLDSILAELHALRDEVAADVPKFGPISDEGTDLSDANLLDTHAASARFGYPQDTLRKWAREGCGVKRGGRWLVDPARLQRRLNGG